MVALRLICLHKLDEDVFEVAPLGNDSRERAGLGDSALSLRSVEAEQAREVVEHLRRAEELWKVGVLRRKAEILARHRVTGVGSEQRDAAAVRPQQAGDHLDHARLPRAIRSEQTEGLAGLQIERDSIDGPQDRKR